MTEKELIRQSMASNLKLPTDLTADEAIEKKPAKASVRFSYFGRAAVFAALALAIGTAGFLFLKGTHKPEASSSQQQLTPTSQQPTDSSKQIIKTVSNGLPSEVNDFISLFVSDDKLFYAVHESTSVTDYTNCHDITSESKLPDVHSRTAAALGEYLLGVEKMKVSSDISPYFIHDYKSINMLGIHRKDSDDHLTYEEDSEHNGYIHIELAGRIYEYSFDVPSGLYSNSFFSQYGKNLPIDWETNTSDCKDFVTKQELENTNGKLILAREVRDNISVQYKINTLYDAAFIYDVHFEFPGGVSIKGDKVTVTVTPRIKGADEKTLTSLSTTYETTKDEIASQRFLYKEKESYKDMGEVIGYDVQLTFEVYDDSNPLGFGREYTSVTTINSYYGINTEDDSTSAVVVKR